MTCHDGGASRVFHRPLSVWIYERGTPSDEDLGAGVKRGVAAVNPRVLCRDLSYCWVHGGARIFRPTRGSYE